LITNDEELDSLIRFEKSKYFIDKGYKLRAFKGVKEEDIK